MGMAASQARFLGLTARKTNVEYEGQQVNQQRTVLANESSGLFNQMLTLQVPVPPSATDYYNTRYTFSGVGADYTITQTSAGTGSNAGLYNIVIQYDETKNVGFSNSPISKNVPIYFDKSSGTAIPTKMIIGGTEYAMTVADKNGDDKGNLAAIYETIAKQEPGRDPSNETFYKYTYKPGEVGERTYYISSYDIDKISGSIPDDPAQSYINGLSQYYAAETTVKSETKGTASFTTTTDGRFEEVLINSVDDPDMNATLAGRQFDLTLKTVQDDLGYAEAMKQYEYDKMKYERAIQDINARTEVLQQQDRTLELRLKQLDTEQKALSTEMEAVQSVIKKNVETTFKTFA